MLSKCQEWSDGGLWGYVVLVSAFMIQVITFGTAQSIGVYNVEFLDYFESSAAAISLVGSINVGIFLGAGPIAGLLMNYLSHRQVALIGASISSIGLTCMPFTPNLEYMYFFYGVLTGLGYSLLFVPSHVLCGIYFKRHRSLATGIVKSGEGVGCTVFPYIIYTLIETYGWKGSFFLMAGLSLQNFLFAALLRPSAKHVENENDQETTQNKVDQFVAEHEYLEMKHKKLEGIDINTHSENKHLMQMGSLRDTTSDSSQGETHRPEIAYENVKDKIDTHTAKDVEGKNIFVKIRDQLRKVFTFAFTIFFINNILWNMGSSTVILFSPEFNVNAGLEKEDATIVFMLIGGGTCVGCILGGLLGNIRCCNRIAVYVMANVATGSLTLLFPLTFLHTFWGLLILSTLWGLMFGVILGLLMVVTADLLGAEALGDGYGYLMLANGIGCSIAPPLAGWLLDITGELVPGFLLAGLITILGGLLIVLIPLQHRLCPVKDNTAEIQLRVEMFTVED
ncbi:hypothetical protein ACJMK2_014199 [Sinanodonta woodiana]|uniref:Major facilitator superfamily (MFS) profile domain-containing protein n=1 Tax=Sinanodonta woodiana TaxID=1069815 RepID=A0ABD3UZZ3_SINWO